jgi:hypothetical protein
MMPSNEERIAVLEKIVVKLMEEIAKIKLRIPGDK